MVTISLCMIVKNEAAVLARCLDSVQDVVDEIVIVDTGSTDRTREIARSYTPHVHDFEWVDDFSAARNFAYSLATMDYQLWLDADDYLPEAELWKLRELKDSLTPDTDMVTMKYHTHFDQEGNPTLTSTRERLTKREKNYQWQDPIHECIPLTGNIHYSDITIWHLKPHSNEVSTRNLDIYENLEAKGRVFTPRQQYYFARELKDHRKYAKSIYYFERFLNGGQGWLEDNIAACFNLAVCYHGLGDEEKVLPVLLRSFEMDAPRGEICSEIGYYYKRKQNQVAALKWFEIAANLGAPNSLGFVLRDYWDFIPYVECCVLHSLQKDFDKAREYHEKAKALKPNHPAVLHNETYLQTV